MNAMTDEQEELSQADRIRFAKSAKQIMAYTNFLRWSANFRSDEIITHPRHRQVVLLSPTQSSRFSYAMSDETVVLGVQPFEASWYTAMPFDMAYVTDRLYLRVRSTAVLSTKIPALTIGIYVNDKRKLAEMMEATFLEARRVEARDGVVVAVGGSLGAPLRVCTDDLIADLRREQRESQHQLDVNRFL